MEKTNNIKKWFTVYGKKIAVLIFISWVIAFLGMFFFNKPTKDILKEVYHSFGSKGESLLLGKDELIPKDYSINGEVYTSLSADPWFTAYDVNCEIDRLDIVFGKPVGQPMDIQIYYTLGDEGFNGDSVIRESIEANRTKVRIYFGGIKICSLRIDIGTREGVTFELERVMINGKLDIKALWREWIEAARNMQFNGLFFNRVMIISLLIAFLGLHLVFKVADLYNFLFRNRWAVGGLLLLFMVINKYNGDSLVLYDNYVQQGEGSEYIEPVIGTPRSIRSDEWIVSNPIVLGILNGSSIFEKYNQASRGTDTLNAVYGLHFGLAMLAKSPYNIVYAILPLEYAYSFTWYLPIILSFLISVEMGLIITKGNKMLSVLCGILLACSPWYFWWGFPGYFISAQGCIVCANYFLKTDIKWKRILYGLGLTLAFSNFVINTYPAWQVPVGWMFLAILIWFVHQNKDRIKLLDRKDISILAFCAFGAIVLIAYTFLEIREYNQIIMDTVYPGQRRNYGGTEVGKLFYYFQSVYFPYKYILNPCEPAGIICLFPIPTVLAIYLYIKQKNKDWLLGGLLIVDAILIIYILFPVSKLMGDLTMLSYSFPRRVADIVCWINVYLLLRILSYPKERKRMPVEYKIIVIITSVFLGEYFCSKAYPDYLSTKMGLMAVFMYLVVSIHLFILKEKKHIKRGIVLLGVIGLIAGIGIRPIVKGLEGIYSKPVAGKIQDILEEDKMGKWLAMNDPTSSFLVACGASTVTSVNTYPNLQLWRKLDPAGKYEKIYNRYAHIYLDFVDEETSFELIKADYIRLHLSYNDIQKTGAKYLFLNSELKETHLEKVTFEMIYDEKGAYIYKIICKGHDS